ncbi:hypothetical protein [Clostridium fessum]|uniref:hypothetical protein n=1 Tax=Clostridium fessum TaxID=2126740 RepID=UPI00399EF145
MSHLQTTNSCTTGSFPSFQPILIATKADKIKRKQLQKQLKILRQVWESAPK